MNEAKFQQTPGLIRQDMGDELLLYDSERETIHTLNPTARLIWELCDGTHTIEDMEQAIRAHFAVSDGHDVSEDIQEILKTFATKGLLKSY